MLIIFYLKNLFKASTYNSANNSKNANSLKGLVINPKFNETTKNKQNKNESK
jgi:hypothetical protein